AFACPYFWASQGLLHADALRTACIRTINCRKCLFHLPGWFGTRQRCHNKVIGNAKKSEFMLDLLIKYVVSLFRDVVGPLGIGHSSADADRRITEDFLRDELHLFF